MKREDMIAEIKRKYCGKCPVHLNKMRSAELEALLRGGGATGGESRLQPQNRIVGKFTPQKAPKTNSNQYEKDIMGKRKIVKTRKEVGEKTALNARLRPSSDARAKRRMRDDVQGTTRGTPDTSPDTLSRDPARTTRSNASKNRLRRRLIKQTKKANDAIDARKESKEMAGMGGEDINRAKTKTEFDKEEADRMEAMILRAVRLGNERKQARVIERREKRLERERINKEKKKKEGNPSAGGSSRIVFNEDHGQLDLEAVERLLDDKYRWADLDIDKRNDGVPVLSRNEQKNQLGSILTVAKGNLKTYNAEMKQFIKKGISELSWHLKNYPKKYKTLRREVQTFVRTGKGLK